jgi:hypothetical protein
MSDRRYEFLVAMHEVIKAFLCKTRGVTQQRVESIPAPVRILTSPSMIHERRTFTNTNLLVK